MSKKNNSQIRKRLNRLLISYIKQDNKNIKLCSKQDEHNNKVKRYKEKCNNKH
jgi:hypothetical protein